MAQPKLSGIKYGDLKKSLELDDITLSLGNIDPNTEMTESAYNLLRNTSKSNAPPPFNDPKVEDHVLILIKGYTEDSERRVNEKNNKFYIIIILFLIILIIMLIVFYLDYRKNITSIYNKL